MTRAVRSATVGMVLVLVARLAARLRLLQAIPAIPARPGSERAKHNKRVLGPDQPALSFRARRRFLPMSLASNAGVASPALGMASMPTARSPAWRLYANCMHNLCCGRLRIGKIARRFGRLAPCKPVPYRRDAGEPPARRRAARMLRSSEAQRLRIGVP